MQTVTQKLEAVESAMRRWHARLTRASNMIRKLEAKRRRLLAAKPVWHIPDKPKAIAPPVIRADDPDLVEKVTAALDRSRAEDDLSVPAFLARPVDTMTVTRQVVSAEDRKKMPLSGREALAAIRAASAKVTARRAKRKTDGF